MVCGHLNRHVADYVTPAVMLTHRVSPFPTFFLEITKQREEIGIDDPRCVFYWTDHIYQHN